MDRRKPPHIKKKAWREKEALENLKSESPSLRKRTNLFELNNNSDISPKNTTSFFNNSNTCQTSRDKLRSQEQSNSGGSALKF